MTPWYLNLFENALTVQFNHRMVAYALVLWALAHSYMMVSQSKQGPVAVSATLLLIATLAQVALGIATLLAQVPISLGLAHQGMAIVVFALALAHLSQLLPTPARDPR